MKLCKTHATSEFSLKGFKTAWESTIINSNYFIMKLFIILLYYETLLPFISLIII